MAKALEIAGRSARSTREETFRMTDEAVRKNAIAALLQAVDLIIRVKTLRQVGLRERRADDTSEEELSQWAGFEDVCALIDGCELWRR